MRAYASFWALRHNLELELIVSLMRADPEPVIMTVSLASQCTVTATDLDSVNSAFLAKAQGGVPRIRLKQSEIFIRKLLNVRWKFFVALPERLQRM